MNLNIKSLIGLSDFFALDVGSSSVRVVQLRGGGATKSLSRYGSVPVDAKTAESDAVSDQKKLAQIIATVVKQSDINVRDVVVGIPSNKMFATVVDFPNLPRAELDKTVAYQIESHVPMKVDEAKIDWDVLGESPSGADQVEVLIAAVTNTYVESRMDMLESIGLNVVAFEPESLALMRSLLPINESSPVLILDIGYKSTDLVISYQDAPRLMRSIPTGNQTFIKAAMQNLNIDEKQANQFVYKFGLNQDKLEGQVYRALENVVDQLIAEVSKSIKYFSNRYKGVNIEKLVVSGGAATLPGFPLHLANKIGIQVEIGNSWLNVAYPQSSHNDLIALSNHFSVAVGLAERR